MSQGSSFKSVFISRDSEQNGQYTKYEFSVELRNPAPRGSILLITIPSSVSVKTIDGTFIDCLGEQNLKSSLECKLSGRKIQVTLDFEK